MAMNQRAKAATESAIFLAILAGIFVLLNVSGMFFRTPRLDLTARRLFTLSDGSKRLAGSLSDNMEIRAYFSADLPPPFNSTERYVRDMLTEYQAASKGKIRVRFINPDNEEKRTAADQDGVQRASHRVYEEDVGQTTREGYRGLVFEYLGDKQVIAMVNDTSGLEYEITMLIKRMTGEKIKIGVLGGHGGPTLAEGLDALKSSLPTYEITEVAATSEISHDLRALLIIEPETEITDIELRNINKFVMEGGSLGVFGGTMKMPAQDPQGQAPQEATAVETHINTLLNPWGAQINTDIVADPACIRTQMVQQTQFGQMQTLVPYYIVPIATFDRTQQEHPAAFRLENQIFPFTSSLQRTNNRDPQVKIRTIARSSENAWRLTDASVPLQPAQGAWRQTGRETVAYAYAIEGKLPSAFSAAMSTGVEEPSTVTAPDRATRDVRVFVLGSGKFMTDALLIPPNAPREQVLAAIASSGRLALVLNTIDWLAQDSDLIAVRAKNIEDPIIAVPQAAAAEREIEQAQAEGEAAVRNRDAAGVRAAQSTIEQAEARRKDAMAAWKRKKDTYKFINMLGLPALVAVFGLLRWMSRKAKKASTITV